MGEITRQRETRTSAKENIVKITAGTKTTIPLPNGLRWPGVALTDAEGEKVIIVDRNTHEPVEITVTRYTVITLRETREGVKYLALTSEVANYGYRVVAEPRFSTVVGLDATEDGEKISLQSLMETHGASFSAWQEAQFNARKGITSAEDI